MDCKQTVTGDSETTADSDGVLVRTHPASASGGGTVTASHPTSTLSTQRERSMSTESQCRTAMRTTPGSGRQPVPSVPSR